jgi:hypothetical protein
MHALGRFVRQALAVSPLRWRYWLAWALGVRLLWWAVLFSTLGIAHQRDGLVGVFYAQGDSRQYLELAEHFVQTGTYADSAESPNSFAARMPGLSAPYVLFRLMLPQTGAVNAVFILQMVLSALSVYAVGRMAYLITRHQGAFVISFFMYALSAYAAAFDVAFLTESIATSCIAIAGALSAEALYGESTASAAYRYRLFALAGLMATWAVFLRPVVAPWLVCLALATWVGQRGNIKQKTVAVLALLLPFTVLEGTWVLRNAHVYNRLVPATSTLYAGDEPSAGYEALLQFVRTWGGSTTYWYADAEVRFFYAGGVHYPRPDSLSAYALAAGYTQDSLRTLRAHTQALLDDNTPAVDSAVRVTCARYTQLYRADRPMQVWVVAPLRLTKRLLLQTGTHYLSAQGYADAGWAVRLFKWQQAAVYSMLLLGALLSLSCFVWGSCAARWSAAVCWLFVLSQIVLHCAVFRHVEHRFVLPCLPVMAALCGLAWQSLVGGFNFSFRRFV